MVQRLLSLCLLVVISSLAYSQTQHYKLANGLNVVVEEDHRSPQVISMVWYNVGSADEPGNIYGVSHVLEHYLFKGTPTFPHGQFSRLITAVGGEFNALTSNDYTTFYEKVATANLETCFKLEADRMQNLVWNDQEFAKEMQVIREERRLRIEDNPQATALERFLATAHISSPYQHPVIGWMYNLRQMTMLDAKHWYERYYAPNNATLVIVGDVVPKQVLALAKQYFGPIGSKVIPQRKPQGEPPHLGKKNILIHTQAKLPILILGYTAPTLVTAKTTDPYVLEMMAALLGIRHTGRLSTELEQKQQRAGATAVYYNLYARYPTQFALMAIPTQTTSLDQLQTALLAQIERLKTERVSVAELQQAKTQIIAQKTFEKDALFNQAMEIGLLETVGLGSNTAEHYFARINAVTPEQIQTLARQYFQENNLTEARLVTD